MYDLLIGSSRITLIGCSTEFLERMYHGRSDACMQLEDVDKLQKNIEALSNLQPIKQHIDLQAEKPQAWKSTEGKRKRNSEVEEDGEDKRNIA